MMGALPKGRPPDFGTWDTAIAGSRNPKLNRTYPRTYWHKVLNLSNGFGLNGG